MSSSKQPYHSALGVYRPLAKNTSIKPAFFPYGEVHYYDVTRGFNGLSFIERADVLYSDLPWKSGYEKFYERSESIPRIRYELFLGYVSHLVRVIKKPAVMISGEHARRNISFCDSSIPILLNGSKARAYLWNIFPEFLEYEKTALDIIYRLAGRFECVGDMFCGYGLAGRVFASLGKRFILSDINPDCIGYITENAEKWGPHENLR